MAEPLPDVDPNVRVPPAVQRQIDHTNQIIEQLKPAADPPVETPPVTAAVTPPAAPVVQPTPAQTPPAAAAPAEPPALVTPPAAEDEDSQTWKQRYHAMKGRFDQSMNTVRDMQTQMRELGDELIRMQDFIKNNGNVTSRPQGQPAQRLVTDKDRETYGDELIDTVQRAALEAVTPQLNAVEQENKDLKRDLARQRTADVHRALDGSVPQWRAINHSPRFKQWLSLTDLLAGSARGHLLNAAFKAADAPRVVAFFKAFVQDEAATGSTEFAPTAAPQPPATQPAPRQAAVALETLAAPGRAKPAAADTGRSAEKPVFTRAQIRQFYDECRRGAYAGRDQEKAAYETAIFAAQNEGRIR